MKISINITGSNLHNVYIRQSMFYGLDGLMEIIREMENYPPTDNNSATQVYSGTEGKQKFKYSLLFISETSWKLKIPNKIL